MEKGHNVGACEWRGGRTRRTRERDERLFARLGELFGVRQLLLLARGWMGNGVRMDSGIPRLYSLLWLQSCVVM